MDQRERPLTLVELEKYKIPKNIRRLQETLGFSPGQPITKETFDRLVLVELKDEKNLVRSETEKKKNMFPAVKLPEKPKTEKRKLNIEEYRNIHSKMNNPESMIFGRKSDVKDKPVERKSSAKEKAFSNWGVHTTGKSVNKKDNENVKEPMNETDVRRSIAKEKAYSIWGVHKTGKSVIKKDNEKVMNETDLRRSMLKRKLEGNLGGDESTKMAAKRSS